jgi:hypothetical protein
MLIHSLKTKLPILSPHKFESYKTNLWGLKIGSLVFKEWINMLFEKTSANRIGISTW